MKKNLSVVISLILAICLTGCGLIPSLDLTDSEQKVIAEYAAGLLLKHDKNYSGSIYEVEEEEDLAIYSEPVMQEYEEALEESGDSGLQMDDPEFSEDLAAKEQSMGEDTEYSNVPIAQAIGLDGFDIIYKSFSCSKIYPSEENSDLTFSLEAAPGMELLVLSFGVTNNNSDRTKCDILNSDVSFRILINGSERVQAQKTMLLNDLGTFSDDIEGYGVNETVLVFEIAEGTSGNINSLDLILKNGDVTTTHRLR